MKKVFIVSALAVTGLLSAKNAPEKENESVEKKKATCNWCVRSGEQMHCASAATCDEAKATAFAMAAAEQ